MAVGVLEHGVAALQRRQRRQRAGPGALVGDVVGGPVEAVPRGAAGAVAQRLDLVGAGVEQRAAGRPAPGGSAARRAPACSRVEPAGQGGPEPVAADARRCAAPRRRRGRPAWRRRWAWRRGRRRPGRAAAGRARGRSRRRRACGTACTARISPSSENGSRSSTEPPPRATTITSTRASRSRRSTASITSAAARRALHGGVRRLEGDRGPAAAGVLEHVALGGGVGRGDQPDAAGQERQRPLELGRRTAPRPPAADGAARAGRAARRGRPAGSRGPRARGCRGWRSRTAWRARRRWRPRRAGGLRPSKSVRGQVTGTEMSATESRRVRKTVLTPGRRLTWATWPSTHTAPSRSTQPAIALAIWRTGAGAAGRSPAPWPASLGDGERRRLTACAPRLGGP